MTAEPVADERTAALQHGADKAGKEAGLPGEVGVLRFEVDRRDDQENEGDEADGIDAVRQCGDIHPAGPDGQLPCLPGIEQVAEQNRKGRARHNPAVDQFRRHSAHVAAQDGNEHQLQQVIDEQPEEPVDVPADEPADFARISNHNPGYRFA